MMKGIGNGIGTPREYEKQIGTPGFTTKKEQGSGFGLASARQYMQSIGGNFDWTNRAGQGFTAVFDIQEYDDLKHKSQKQRDGLTERKEKP